MIRNTPSPQPNPAPPPKAAPTNPPPKAPEPPKAAPANQPVKAPEPPKPDQAPKTSVPQQTSSADQAPKDDVQLSPELQEESQKAEPTNPDASIAVFDDFRGADDPGQTTHGELVEGEILQAGFEQDDIQRYQVGAGVDMGALTDGLANGDGQALDNFIESTQTGMLDSTSDALQEVIDDPNSKVTTVSQSSSQAEARVTRDLLQKSKDSPEFRGNLEKTLGLPEGASDSELAQALVNRVDDVVENSDAIKDSQERYDAVSAEAADQGINHVVTAGNLGEFEDELNQLGVSTDGDFYDSSLSNEYTTTVGGTDGHGTASGADDTNAVFNADAGAEISAPGVQVPITTADGETKVVDGTSFSAPQVAAADAQVAAANPSLTPQQREDVLTGTATTIPQNVAPQSDIGAGVLDPTAAVLVAGLQQNFGR